MNENIIELKVEKSYYNSLQWQAAGGVVAKTNNSSDNWYLTNAINIACEKEFWNDKKEFSPRLVVDNTHPWSIPLINKYEFPKEFINNTVIPSISTILSCGYYIYYNNIDDFYIDGKQSFNLWHNPHDGLITGIDNSNKTISIFGYDINNHLSTIRAPQEHFVEAFFSKYNNKDGVLLALKNNNQNFDYNFDDFLNNLNSYLHSQQTDVYKNINDFGFGLEALNLVVKYVEEINNKKMPLNLLDLRVFMSIYENKQCIYNSLSKAKSIGKVSNSICNEYLKIVQLSENVRLLSIKCLINHKYNILSVIAEKIEEIIMKEKNTISRLLENENYI